MDKRSSINFVQTSIWSSKGYITMDDYRNWLELHSDITLTILMKIPQLDILQSAQFVCKPWYDLCKDPSMWRSIKLKNLKRGFMAVTIAESQVFGVRKELKRLTPKEPRIRFNHWKMVLHAVDRSGGGLVDLDIEGFVPSKLFSYVASRSTQLKRLRVAYSDDISSNALIKALEKLSSLDELELTHCDYGDQIISNIKTYPSSLTTLKLNKHSLRNPYQASDEVALVIAESLPQLRHLQLKGNDMTIFGLMTILDECPHLQSLDVRKCFNLDLEGDLGKTLLKQFSNVQILYDSTKDRDNSTYHYDYDMDDVPYVDTDFEEYYDFSKDESPFNYGYFC